MNTIHVCIAADNNYKLPLKTLVNSIYLNSSTHKCVVHVLYSGLSDKYRDKLCNTYKNTNLSLDFIDMSNYKFDFHGLDMQYWTNAIFYRIMIPEIFKDLERILYIDGDTLVLKDLYDFFNTEFPDEVCLAMVVDRFSWKTHTVKLNVSNYYNSGMILFGLDKCRKFNFSHKCVQWIHDFPEMAEFPDQDAINTICNNKILRVNNIYNKQFAPNDIITIDSTPFIVHFLSAIKPWMKNAGLNYSKTYRRYIPNKITKTIITVRQFLHNWKSFCFHKNIVKILQKSSIVEQKRYYVFNICVYVKTLAKKNLIDALKELKKS